jgi:DTW domain-containing protein YfiP
MIGSVGPDDEDQAEEVQGPASRGHVTIPRCRRCLLPGEECMCASLRLGPALTRVVAVGPVAEFKKPTNTGRLLPLLLEGAELRPRGQIGAPLDLGGLALPGRRLLLLDPTAPTLLARDPLPATLIVADGSWRQARRLMNRCRGLDVALRVRLPEGAPTRYRLRSPRSRDKVSTLEAVARALGVLEGPEQEERLERVFDELVTRTLRARANSLRTA